MSSLRRARVALLAVSTVLFAVGVISENSVKDEHASEPAVAVDEHREDATEEAAHSEAEEEAGHQEGVAEATHVEGEEDERLLGVDLESTPLVVLAVIGGLALAVLAASRMGEMRPFLFAVVVLALVWAALDVREVVHQIDESHEGIALLAGVVAALHVAAAGVAGRLGLDPRT